MYISDSFFLFLAGWWKLPLNIMTWAISHSVKQRDSWTASLPNFSRRNTHSTEFMLWTEVIQRTTLKDEWTQSSSCALHFGSVMAFIWKLLNFFFFTVNIPFWFHKLNIYASLLCWHCSSYWKSWSMFCSLLKVVLYITML